MPTHTRALDQRRQVLDVARTSTCLYDHAEERRFRAYIYARSLRELGDIAHLLLLAITMSKLQVVDSRWPV